MLFATLTTAFVPPTTGFLLTVALVATVWAQIVLARKRRAQAGDDQPTS